jgi:hypothetical protein
LGIGIGKREDLRRSVSYREWKLGQSDTYLVFNAFDAAPATHNEGVISSDDGDDVDAFGFEFVILLDVGWEVVHMASGLEEWFESNRGRRKMRLTVKAPGTEKRTTFFPFHSL